MTEYPVVSIIMTTYDPGSGKRFELAKQTLQALTEKLLYQNLHWIIADDSAEGTLTDQFTSLLENKSHEYTFSNRTGVGKSKNIALAKAFEKSPYVLLLEDDWLLKYPLDLYPYVKTLEENEDIGMVRFGFLGGGMTAELVELSGKTYWQLVHKSGHYIYSGQVSFRHKRLYDTIGYHIENVQAGKEEEAMCHRYNDFVDVPAILWDAQFGVTINAGVFANIGLDNSVNAVEPENNA